MSSVGHVSLSARSRNVRSKAQKNNHLGKGNVVIHLRTRLCGWQKREMHSPFKQRSALSRKKVAGIASTDYLSRLKQRLLKFCKDMRFPVTKVHKLKNLAKDILEEQHKMKASEDTLEYLKHNIKEAVDTENMVENSIEALEKMVETLNEQESETSQFQDEISNIDPLELPQGTFEAPTMQDMAKKLKNPKLILKKLSRVQSNPIYTDAMNLLQMAYAEISTL
ncbi:centromere protein Q-like [Anomaloglossus baeobatrachus]|uniref:centromere protein Q-like n=1 Tax=Anomaloglossus baeobatrachus TaxID=238106 RepID=UPI003F4FA618